MKPSKLKSINDLSVIWVEECSEVKYEGYKELLGRLRHLKMSNHIICSTNPVGTDNWTYGHFFKDDLNDYEVLDDNILYEKGTVVVGNTMYHHSTCDDNHFLPQDYLDELDEMKRYDKDLYRVARLGRYGVNGTKVLPNFRKIKREEAEAVTFGIPDRWHKYGLDFGFEESYNALVYCVVDDAKKDLYIMDVVYKNKITDPNFVKDIERFKDKWIVADNAEPKTIAYYCEEGFNMTKCKKFAGSRLSNTKKMKRFKNIYCCDDLAPVIKELENLTYKKDKNGNNIYDEFNIDPHSFSALWYALDDYEVSDVKFESKSRGKKTAKRGGRRF